MRLKAPKPQSSQYPKSLNTLGDHIRKKRLDLGLLQREVALQIGVAGATIYNWEGNETAPPVRHIPRIIQFLGFNPLQTPRTVAERLLRARKALGLTQKAMARQLGIDPTTLARWERGERKPSRKLVGKVSAVLAGF